MKKYETIAIAKPELEEKTNDILTKYQKIINESGGNVEAVESLGIKKLLVEVCKKREGLFLRLYFEGEEKTKKELERVYRIDDDILKFIIYLNE